MRRGRCFDYSPTGQMFTKLCTVSSSTFIYSSKTQCLNKTQQNPPASQVGLLWPSATVEPTHSPDGGASPAPPPGSPRPGPATTSASQHRGGPTPAAASAAAPVRASEPSRPADAEAVQLLWETFWRFFPTLNTKLPQDPAIPLWRVQPREVKIRIRMRHRTLLMNR